ncbi:MAG: DMT family transporter [Treponema sp.]
MSKKSASLLGAAGCLTAACIWGFAFVVVKDSLDYVSAVYMMALRFTIASVGLTLVFFKKMRAVNPHYLRRGAVLGAFVFTAYALQTVGCNFTTAGKNAFLTTTYVVLVPIFAWGAHRKRPPLRIFAAAVIQLAGIGFLSLGKEEGRLFYIGLGDALTLLCGIFYALHIVFQEKYCRSPVETEKENENAAASADDPIILTILTFIFAGVFSWLAAPFYDEGKSAFSLSLNTFPLAALTNPRVAFSMVYLGVFSTMIAFLLQNICLKYVPAPLASLLLSFESVFGMLFSVLIPVNGAQETLSAGLFTGCALIFAAIVIAEGRFNYEYGMRN